MKEIETSNVKEMLLDGATKEELIKALEDEIESAQKEIDAAKASAEQDEADMEEIRMDLICCVIEYLDALGLVDEDKFEDEDIERLNHEIKEIEKEMMPQILFLEAMKRAFTSEKNVSKEKDSESQYKHKNADEIIKKFLKSL